MPAQAGKLRQVDDPRRGVPGAQFAPSLGGEDVHNVGAMQLNVTNFGLLGSLPGSRAPYSDAPSAQWPPSSGIDYLYAAGLWVGALVDDQPHVTGIVQTPERIQFEFRPGASELDRIYHTRELMLHGARLPNPNADDDGDGRFDEDPLDGRDNDGDGRIDEDYAAMSNQMFTCEFADTDPAIRLAVPDHRPLGLRVTQTTLAWEGAVANSFIGLDYRIENVGRDFLQRPCVGFYADYDIGARDRGAATQDDLAGYWIGTRTIQTSDGAHDVHLEVGYMFDDDGDDGEAQGYIGIVFLGWERDGDETVRPLALDNFRTFLGNGGYESGGDPTNDDQRYAILDGTAPQSLPPVNERRSYVLRHPGDYRTVCSAGPFPMVLAPGTALHVQAALVIGRGLDDFLDHTVAALQTLQGVWLDCDGNPSTGVDGREEPLCAPEYQGRVRVDPCDARCDRMEGPPCQLSVPSQGCVWVNGDCEVEVETGETTGVGGRECHVVWTADSPPTPPAIRIAAYEDRVEIYWDDRSETTVDLVRGEIDFESYRIWRAEGWTRPLGTNERSGPPPNLWALLGEFDVRNGVGSDTGLGAVHYQPHVAASLIAFYQQWYAQHPGEPPPEVQGYTWAQCDTAQALARGRRYYLFVDPPFVRATPGEACPANRLCDPIRYGDRWLPARCDANGQCRATTPPPHPGMHLFYSVTANDHRLASGPGGDSQLAPGLNGEPGANFVYVVPPTSALPRERSGDAESEIYVVPNPATIETLAPWRLQPNNGDPTGIKVEFHHLPQSTGKVIIWTLAGDRVRDLSFDARNTDGTLAWDLVSRNGQDVASGVYLYTVEADDPAFKRVIGKLVVIR
jgi:hypothetical protein